MNKVTRNQHYVWRYYLRPWCECKNANKEIYFIWWNNKITRRFTNVFDILREIDFYQFNSLNNIEQFLLVNLFAKSNQKEVISANKDIIFLSGFISSIESIIGSDNTEFKKTQIKYGEEYQTKIEKLGFYGIDQLVKGDLSWISNQEKRTEFMLFICIQYFRTKAMKLNVLNKMNTESNMIIQKYNEVYDNSGDCSINWGNIYNYGLICLANNLCYNLLAKKMCFKLLKSKNYRFIVSDQPVYNIGDYSKNELILFCPISPNNALLGSCDLSEDTVEFISDEEVFNFNKVTVNHAYQFIMGKEESDINVCFSC